jgi:hypothetical protein
MWVGARGLGTYQSPSAFLPCMTYMLTSPLPFHSLARQHMKNLFPRRRILQTIFLIQIKIQAVNMGISHSTARWVAPLSFAIDFAAQQYGMLSSPNMKDVHDANLSFWSPQPYFIAGFFFPQQLFQLAWLYRLWKMDPTKSANDKAETQIMVDFVPYYAVGNLCIASMLSLSETLEK